MSVYSPRRRPTMVNRASQMPGSGYCAHCKRRLGSFASGYAAVGSNKLCRPNVEGRPKCYDLVTEHGHEMPCTLEECYEAREESAA